MSLKNPHRALPRVFAAILACLCLAPAQAQDILIGQVASQTNAITGANAKGVYLGMSTYFESINSQGGVHGRNVKLVTKDDGLVAAKMVEMTREYIADKNVLALAGYLSTGGITEVSKQDIPGKAGIAMIVPQQGDRSIVGADNFFPFRSGYPDEVVALVKEAADTQKKKLVVVYWTATFGPAMAKLAQEVAKEKNLNVGAVVKMDVSSMDKFDAVVKEAVAAVAKESPDAVLMLIASRWGNEFIKQIKKSPAANAQLYTNSVVVIADIVKAAGPEGARGIVVAQSVPYPFSATLPVVGEYQKMMKKYLPNEPLAFSTFEGFVAGKITIEALKRTGPNPTREKLLKTLNNMGEYNLGGVYVNYTPTKRVGWGGIDLTIIGQNGKLLR